MVVRYVAFKAFPHSLVAHKGPADDGKRNEMEMDVAYRAGGQMGGGLGEGGGIIDLERGSADFFLGLWELLFSCLFSVSFFCRTRSCLLASLSPF